MKEFTITKNDASLRLDKFITKNCPTLPSSLMFKYIRTKRIKVNGKRAEISTRLNEGDKVEAYINDEFFTEIKPTYDFNIIFTIKANTTLRTKTVFVQPLQTVLTETQAAL